MDKLPSKNLINLMEDPTLAELNDHKFFGIMMSKIPNISSEKLKTKLLEIVKLLNNEKIEKDKIKKIIFEGLPDDIPSLRSLAWKLLFNYLPDNVNEWEDSLDIKRSEYIKCKKELYEKLELEIILKRKTENENNLLTKEKNIEPTKLDKKFVKKRIIKDHPLSLTNNSKWKSYFDDLELLEEIEKDVRRTRTHMHFFFMPAKNSTVSVSNERITELADKKRNDHGPNDKLLHKNSFETNADVMSRILFIFGKKYPQIRYVQGMNEILAPIFYTFSSDQNPYFYLNLEADAYICFEAFMIEIKDIFIRSKDNTESGIQTRIKNLNCILKLVDREVYEQLLSEKVELQYFVFRWYTLFMTQEFEMPDILRIWDSVLADDDKFEFINMICLAIIKIKRTEILQSDFAGIMLSLQNLEKMEVEKMLQTAESIRIDLYKNNI